MTRRRRRLLRDPVVRIVFLYGMMLLAMVFLLVFLWRVQVAHGDKYQDDQMRQSVRRVRLPGIRGRIFDRNHHILADNRPSYCVALYLEELRKPGPWRKTVDHVEGLVQELSELLGLEPDIDREDIVRHINRRLPLPLIAWRELDEAGMARLAERGLTIPGVDIYPQSVRTYPGDGLACHTIGYVGRADPPEENEPYHYYVPEMEGKSGVEASLDDELRGTPGGRLMRVDVSGYRRHDIASKPPRKGRDVLLSLDRAIQSIAEKVMADETGSLVVLDPASGDVLALVSSPGYSLNDFVPAISHESWGRLREDERVPLLHRAISGAYAPGSTFKPLVGLAGLANGYITTETVYDCPGAFMLGNATFRCWLRRGHGPVNLRQALDGSCNVYFFHAGLKAGIDAVVHMAAACGLGRKTGIPLGGEVVGLVPDDAWKRRTYDDGWRDGDTCNVAIGQGALLATPLQMALVTSVIANRGTLYRPRLVLGSRATDAGVFEPVKPRVVNTLNWNPGHIESVRLGMRDVVMSPTGTGRKAKVEGLVMAGKTGTAEFGRKEDKRRHAWMIAFAPYDDPKWAVALLVDEGVSGGETAAPKMQQLFQGIQALQNEGTGQG